MSTEDLKYILNNYWNEFNWSLSVFENLSDGLPVCDINTDMAHINDNIVKEFFNELEPLDFQDKPIGSVGLYRFKNEELGRNMVKLSQKIYDIETRKAELNKDF